MKKLSAIAAALLLATTASHATEDTTWGRLKASVPPAPLPAAKAAAKDVADVVEFGNPGNVVAPGGSRLTRTNNGVTLNLKTTGLQPGDAVTVWWIVWNDPAACSGVPCGLGDLGVEGSSIARAAGHVVGGDGKGNFNGHLRTGDTSEALFGPGLTDPAGAEIHLVVRSHGPAIPGHIPTQIHTVEDGCAACSDVQAAVHLP